MIGGSRSLGDHVVENRRQLVVARPVGIAGHDERGGGPGDVLARDVNRHRPRRRRPSQAGVGVELAVRGVQREGLHPALRHAVLRCEFRRGRILRADEIVAVAGARLPCRERLELRDLRRVGLAEGRPVPSSRRRCTRGHRWRSSGRCLGRWRWCLDRRRRRDLRQHQCAGHQQAGEADPGGERARCHRRSSADGSAACRPPRARGLWPCRPGVVTRPPHRPFTVDQVSTFDNACSS